MCQRVHQQPEVSKLLSPLDLSQEPLPPPPHYLDRPQISPQKHGRVLLPHQWQATPGRDLQAVLGGGDEGLLMTP